MSNDRPKEDFVAIPRYEWEKLHRKLLAYRRAYFGPTVVLALAIIVWFCCLLTSCTHIQRRTEHQEYSLKMAFRSVLPVFAGKEGPVVAAAVVVKCVDNGPDLVVTAHHVFLVTPYVLGQPLKVVRTHATADVTLTTVEVGKDCVAAKLALQDPRKGEMIAVVGSPGGAPDVVTEGRVIQISTTSFYTGRNHTAIYTTALVRPGNSGGGMFRVADGELVGIVTHYRFASLTGAVLGCADHIDHVRQLLEIKLPEPKQTKTVEGLRL